MARHTARRVDAESSTAMENDRAGATVRLMSRTATSCVVATARFSLAGACLTR